MRAYSIDLRERIIKARLEGQSLAKVAERFGVGASTVARYERQYRQEGSLAPKRRLGRARFLQAEELGALRRQVLDHDTLSQEQHARLFYERHGILLSRATLGRYLKRLGLSRKKSRSGPSSAVKKRGGSSAR